jgi:hypothetical protein
MAGRQRRKEMIHQLERRLAAWTETQEEEKQYTVLDYVVDWVESGRTLLQLSNEVGEAMQWDISRAMLVNYVTAGDPILKRRLEKARLEGAHGAVDVATQIIDDAPTYDKEQLAKAKARADVRLWTAERWNKKELGKAADVQITVNNNTLHIDAMRVRQHQLLASDHEERQLEAPASRARLISVETTQVAEDVIADVVSIEPA